MEDHITDPDYEFYPLTHAQKRVIYSQELYPFSAAFNIGGVFRVDGALDIENLKQALKLAIESIDAFHIIIQKHSGTYRQYFSRIFNTDFAVIDFSIMANPEGSLQEESSRFMSMPFKVFDNPLYEFFLYRQSENQCGFVAKIHHAIFDGWSVGIFSKIIAAFYQMLKNGNSCPTLETPSYKLLIENENNYLNSSVFKEDECFWINEINKLELQNSITGRSTSMNLKGRRKTYTFSKELSNEIKQYIEKKGLSLNVFFSSVVAILLHRWFQSEEAVLGR